MNTLQNADTFFYITSIAVILVSILVIVLLAYAIKAVQAVSHILSTIRRESENVVEDIAELRGRVKQESQKVGAFWQFVTGFFLNRFADKVVGSFGSQSDKASAGSKSRKKAKPQGEEEEGQEN